MVRDDVRLNVALKFLRIFWFFELLPILYKWISAWRGHTNATRIVLHMSRPCHKLSEIIDVSGPCYILPPRASLAASWRSHWLQDHHTVLPLFSRPHPAYLSCWRLTTRDGLCGLLVLPSSLYHASHGRNSPDAPSPSQVPVVGILCPFLFEHTYLRNFFHSHG